MSKDLQATINTPVDFDSMFNSATDIMRKLLKLDELTAINAVNIVRDRTYDQGRIVRDGTRVGLEDRKGIVFGNIEHAINLPNRVKAMLTSALHQQKPMSLEIMSDNGRLLVDCMDSRGTGGIVFYSPAWESDGIVWAICLGLSAAQIGNGKFISYEMWTQAQFSEDPDEFIAMASGLVLQDADSFDASCLALIDALKKKNDK